jgi:cyclopropane fatty-acyl-phospholipid synthase-like methyltransferase
MNKGLKTVSGQGGFMPNSKQLVRSGYNRISRHYRDNRGTGPDAKYGRYWLRELDRHLDHGSRILELGCGMGVPVAGYFSGKHNYLGIDISDVQIQRAKKLVPAASFKRVDMARLRFNHGTFDAILSFYAIIHLPLGEQKPLFHKIFRWLKPGGLFLSILGWTRWTGREKNWHGTSMFWSHADQETYHQWLLKAGFKIIRKRLVREGKGGHYQFLCVKPSEIFGS